MSENSERATALKVAHSILSESENYQIKEAEEFATDLLLLSEALLSWIETESDCNLICFFLVNKD